MDIVDFETLFKRAKREVSLEIMVMGLVRKMNLYYDPSIRSYRVAAIEYKRLGNKKAHKMFQAAYERELEILGKPIPSKSIKSDAGRPSANLSDNEITSWFKEQMQMRA